MDRQSFDRLMIESLSAAQRFAIRLTNDPVAADDLVHDALVRASQAWRSFRATSSFRTWFFQILINVWRDRLRRAGGRHVVDELTEHSAPGHESDPTAGLVQRELGERVAACVSSLPPRQREVLVLVVYEEMTPAQAADVLGVSEQNARVNLHHARQRLRRLLAPYLNAEEYDRPNRSI